MIDVILPIRVRLESLTYGFEIGSYSWRKTPIGRRPSVRYGSPPPLRAATMIARLSLPKSRPLFLS